MGHRGCGKGLAPLVHVSSSSKEEAAVGRARLTGSTWISIKARAVQLQYVEKVWPHPYGASSNGGWEAAPYSLQQRLQQMAVQVQGLGQAAGAPSRTV